MPAALQGHGLTQKRAGPTASTAATSDTLRSASGGLGGPKRISPRF